MESVLISGTNGFLGSHISKYLLAKGYKVFGIFRDASNESDIVKIHDDIISINEIPKEITSILHFAALTDIQYCENNPEECYKINVEGTKNMLELARKYNTKFIFASSSHVFGKPCYLPLDETHPLDPVSVHAKSKAQCESLCEDFSKQYGLESNIIRIFSVYGPASPSYSIIYKIFFQLLNRNKIVLGNINTKRDFLYISDFLSAVDLLLNNNFNGCTKFNLGSGESLSIKDLCNKAFQISNKTSSIESNASFFRENDVKELVCNNTKLKKLGWTPQFSIEQGLTHTFNWIKQQPQ